MTLVTVSAPQQRVLHGIDELRTKYFACTATALAVHLKLNKTYVLTLCDSLRKMGLVDWTTMTGSLHRTTNFRDSGPQPVESNGHPVATVVVPSTGQSAMDAPPDQPPVPGKAGKKRVASEAQKAALARGRATAAANRAKLAAAQG